MALTIAHRGVEENEERLRMAVEVAQMAAWDLNLRSGTMRWSSDPEKLFGFPGGAFGPERRFFSRCTLTTGAAWMPRSRAR